MTPVELFAAAAAAGNPEEGAGARNPAEGAAVGTTVAVVEMAETLDREVVGVTAAAGTGDVLKFGGRETLFWAFGKEEKIGQGWIWCGKIRGKGYLLAQLAGSMPEGQQRLSTRQKEEEGQAYGSEGWQQDSPAFR